MKRMYMRKYSNLCIINNKDLFKWLIVYDEIKNKSVRERGYG